MYTFNQFHSILIYPENFDDKYGVLEDEDMEETDLPCVGITFNVPLKKTDLSILLKYIIRFEYIHITLANYESHVWNNLIFLTKFQRIDSFHLHDETFVAFDELKYLPRDLKCLNLGTTKKKLDLKFLIKFQMLDKLVIEKQNKNLETVGKLKNLTSLTIYSITLPSLDVFLPLVNQLESFDIKLGGTINLESLPKFTKLKYIELWQIRKFTDLTPVFKTKSLECIFIQSLKNVFCLPSMKELINLKCFHIENMKGLDDFRPIIDAPALEDLRLVDMTHLKVEDIEPLAGHPTLKYFRAGLGSLKKNDLVEKIIQLPENYGRCICS
jgi:hypothetical protein